MLITGKISVVRALLYIVVQCAGATAGTASLKSLLSEEVQGGLGHTSLTHVQPLQGLGIEFFLGFILIFTIFGVCDGNKPGKIGFFYLAILSLFGTAALFSELILFCSDSKFVGPLAIGIAVTVGHLGTIKYTGASMNPARTFGTAVIRNDWENHWVRLCAFAHYCC